MSILPNLRGLEKMMVVGMSRSTAEHCSVLRTLVCAIWIGLRLFGSLPELRWAQRVAWTRENIVVVVVAS